MVERAAGSGQRAAGSGQRSAVSGQRPAALLGLAALLTVSTGTTKDGDGPGSSRFVSLSVEQAKHVVGGVDADIVWPGTNNWYQSYDNLRFKVNLTSPSTTPIEVGAWADGLGLFFPTGSSDITFSGGTGLFHRRVNWPHANGAKFDVVMRFNDGGWYDCTGTDPTDTDQYLHPDVKVHSLQVHNVREPDFSWQGS